ncbi:MAG: alcohol dehydrogenase catalytic domain-containing protein [Propionibacteriales bacterium]|nr:alcohol dehydrogenase catalytic domain-containing protein [Propionibacteriales bacterium]
MRSSTMRVAILSAPGTVEMATWDKPLAGAGELVVQVEATSICGSDVSAYRGVHPRIFPPSVLGHECAGVVAEVGDGVPGDLIGTRVCVEPNICCGTCRYCVAGLPNICPDYRVLGESTELPGGLAEYVVVPANQIYELPSSLSPEEGALVQPLAISYEGAVERARVRENERVMILGAGPVGLGAMLLSRLQGAEVLVLDLVDYRLEKARELGAEKAMRADDPALDSVVLDWTDGYGVDAAIEAVGGAQSDTVATAQRLTAPRGRIVVLGSFKQKTLPFAVADLKNREQSLIGSQGHPRTFTPVIDLIAHGSLRPHQLVSHTVGLDDLPDAFRMLDERSDGVMKVVVKQA